MSVVYKFMSRHYTLLKNNKRYKHEMFEKINMNLK